VIAHELIDRAVEGRVLVFGSAPPAGRDLDLLVRPAERAAAEAALTAAGFDRRGEQWVRFASCRAEPVDLVPAAEWRLPPGEERALFEQALPLEGLERLVRPAPHHALLILARRLAEEGELSDKRRARLARAVAEDPEAWERAREHAVAWGAHAELAALEAAQAGDAPPAPSLAARVRGRLARRPGCVIALSGLDGAGKSSQAAALRDALERLGCDATIAWTRITWDDWVWRIAFPVKAVLERVVRAGRPRSAPAAADPVKSVRERSGVLTNAWTLVIAFANAVSQRRLTHRHLRAGRLVVCDRYTLDSVVALRALYGPRRRFRLQRALIGGLSPTPVCAFFLDVPAEVAWERKGEAGVEALARQRALYLEEHARLGVRRLDGTRPREELCAEIAREVWRRAL
jgi:thymidylate kinase